MKQCAFCLRPAKMTGEHIWSAWIGRLFSDYAGVFQVERSGAPATRRWKSRSIDATANVVCEQCNNGWMSDLDAEASIAMANMIRHGSGLSLLARGIASIAAFAFKTAVVVDCTVWHRPRPFFSHADRKRFAATLVIPRGVQVWLSTFRTRQIHGSFTAHYGEIHVGKCKGFEFYIFTYVVGFLVIQLTGFRWNSVAKGPRFMPHLRQGDIWNPVSVPLWPSDGRPVDWPTSQYLTDQTLKILAERWGYVSERIQ